MSRADVLQKNSNLLPAGRRSSFLAGILTTLTFYFHLLERICQPKNKRGGKMEQHREGLNYVPMLTQQGFTPPSSARSRISLHRNRSYRSAIYYNGNYEGDSSMFRPKAYEVERLSLLDSESDAEEVSKRVSVVATVKTKYHMLESNSLFWRLMELLMVKFIKPKISEKLLLRFERFRQSSWCHSLTKWTKLFTLAVAYTLHFVLVLIKNLAALGRYFWKQRVIFHNNVRRLLWRLTLAKCSDRLLFLYVLLSLPILLTLSLIGLTLSICGGLKVVVQYGMHTLKRI